MKCGPCQCNSGCNTVNHGIITFKMFLEHPDVYKPHLYTKDQFEKLSNAGKASYLENIENYNSMCDAANMCDRKIDIGRPWL